MTKTLGIEIGLLSQKLSTMRHMTVLDTKPLFSRDI